MPLPRVRPWKQGDPFSARHLNESVDISRSLYPLTGSGVDIIPGLQGTALLAQQQAQAVSGIYIKIVSYGAIPATDNRWQYGWVEQRCLGTGRWEDKPGGFSHASEGVGGYAYNTIEAFNSAAGYQGNSVNASTLPAGFSIQPVQGNPVVLARRVVTCINTREWEFSYENAVQGACP